MKKTTDPIPIVIGVPEMTIEQYAHQVGVSTRTVEGWVAKGLLPSIKVGRRRLVNMAARTIYCIRSMPEEAN